MRKPEIPFVHAPKTPRLSRECWVTEKLDGCWSAVVIDDSGEIFAASRNRWITPEDDNYSFASWVEGNKSELLKLGPGRHAGEWFGAGIQRRYGISEKRFSLFNAGRWCYDSLSGGVCEVITDPTGKASVRGAGPSCCSVVPTLYRGVFTSDAVEECLRKLKEGGSVAAPGFMQPEGVIVYHVSAGIGFKKTFDDEPKGEPAK